MTPATAQQGNTILIALAGILGLIIISVLLLNHCSRQKIRDMSTTQAAQTSTTATSAMQPENSITSNQPADSDASPSQEDIHIRHMNAYNRKLFAYSKAETDLFDSWNHQYQLAQGQDRLRIRDPLAGMVSAYALMDALDTPDCKRNEKNRKMNIMADGIEELNITDSGEIMSFTRVETSDVASSDCLASMPAP